MSTPPSANSPALEASALPPDTAAALEPSAAASDVTHPPVSARRTTPWSGIVIAAIVVLGIVAALALPRLRATNPYSSPARSIDRDSSAQPLATPAAATAAPVSTDVARPRAIAESQKKTLVKPAARPAAAPATSTPAALAPVVEARSSEPTEPRTGETEPVPAPPLAAAAGLELLTITGCLEVSEADDRFRLTDTEGDSAPKARNWRTGFLKKRSASVNLVGVADALTLKKEIGQRVAATGVLTNRDLKINSVRVVSSHCD